MTPDGERTGRKDRAIVKIVGFLAAAIYRDVVVHWMEEPRRDGPQLTVANHFGGFADGIVLLDALPRRPRVIASDRIWKVPVIGWIMRWIGGIPVRQRSGGARVSNAEMFGACFEALGSGLQLLIFPEGVTRDEPSIARVKTGAARIALGARDHGVDGVVVTPVGIHYEDKAALRSRVVVIVGRSIEVPAGRTDAEIGLDPDHAEVNELTDRMDTELRQAAPDFEGWEEARRLARAADIAVGAPTAMSAYADASGRAVRLANALADRPPDRRAEIEEAVAAYDEQLDRVGLTDREVAGTGRAGLRRQLLLRLLVGLVLLPFAIVGAIIHLVPFLVVKAVGLIPVAPAVQATIKPLAAIGAFGATWVGLAWWAAGEWGIAGAAAALLLAPTYLAAAVAVIEGAAGILRTGSRRGGPIGDDVISSREAVVEAVWAR